MEKCKKNITKVKQLDLCSGHFTITWNKGKENDHNFNFIEFVLIHTSMTFYLNHGQFQYYQVNWFHGLKL